MDELQAKPKKFNILPLIIIVVALIALGAILYFFYFNKNKKADTLPAFTTITSDASACNNLSEGKNIIPLDLLQKNVKFTSFHSSASNSSIELPDFDQTSIDKLLTVIQPYIRSVKGYEYTNAEVTFGPDLNNQDSVEIYVRATTGKKDLNKYKTGRYNGYDPFDDFKTDAFDDFSYYVEFNTATGIIGKITPSYFVGWDVPDNLVACSLGLLENNEKIKSFQRKHKDTITGVTGWVRADPTNNIEDDYIEAMINPATPNQAGCYYPYAHFSVDPWKGTVTFISEENPICVD
ncbi:MAG: hypothetical protein ABIH38_02625 [Patescibacteria group bacterium]